jgi:hypothetical protein
MLARTDPTDEELDRMEKEVADFQEKIAVRKTESAALWALCAPSYWRLREHKRRKREERMGAEMLEKIRRLGETGQLEEPKAVRRI